MAAAVVSPGAAAPDAAEDVLRGLGLRPSRWSAGPGAPFADHVHPRHKVLFCVAGQITFQTSDATLPMVPGDRLDLSALTLHSAVAGSAGVTCVEAFR